MTAATASLIPLLTNSEWSSTVKVEAHIGEVVWRTSVFPLNKGGYLLPIKAEVRRKADLAAGDEVTVELELL